MMKLLQAGVFAVSMSLSGLAGAQAQEMGQETAQASPTEVTGKSEDELKTMVTDLHPAVFFTLAELAWTGGRQDEATFWFYTGQIRYRTYIACGTQLPEDSDQALLATLLDTVGRPINEYAFGDIEGWVATVDRALAWDEEQENGFMTKSDCEAERQQVRADLIELRNTVLATADDVRTQRRENGLENRTP